LVPLNTASCRPQALYLFVKFVDFLIKPHLIRLHTGAAQLVECSANREFVYFCHPNLLGNDADRGISPFTYTPLQFGAVEYQF
jgi:hypothetical protein